MELSDIASASKTGKHASGTSVTFNSPTAGASQK